MRKITVLRIVENAIKTPVSIDITSFVSISHTLHNYITLLIHFIQCIKRGISCIIYIKMYKYSWYNIGIVIDRVDCFNLVMILWGHIKRPIRKW